MIGIRKQPQRVRWRLAYFSGRLTFLDRRNYDAMRNQLLGTFDL
jgi:hypothetical protein